MVSLIGYMADTLTYVGIFGLLSLSLNLEAGYTRLMNFGKVAFFAVGAYVSALLTVSGAPFLAGLAGAILVAGLLGFLIAIPTLKLREDYLAITTIAVAEVVRLVLLNESSYGLGPMGIRNIPRPLSRFFGPTSYPLVYAGLVWAVLGACFLISQRIVNSPFGRVLRAIREDETATEALGKDVFSFKTRALVLGSCMAGAAGSIFAHYTSFVSPDMFMPLLTFSVWTMLIVGGTANNYGAILGAFLIQIFDRSTRVLKDLVNISPGAQANLRWAVIGLLMIIFLMYRPEGVLGERKAKVTAG